jgi:RNA polymerase sigma-70 factor (ECF subfamily)
MWLLTIVRKTGYTSLNKYPHADMTAFFDEQIQSPELSGNCDPAIYVLDSADRGILNRALEELPDMLREALGLRELEGMTCQETADVTASSMGTIMLRLARARTSLMKALSVEISRGY